MYFYSRLAECLGVWLQPLQDWLKSSAYFHLTKEPMDKEELEEYDEYELGYEEGYNAAIKEYALMKNIVE